MAVAELETILPTNFPGDRPTWKQRREATKIAANFASLATLTDGIVADATITVGDEANDIRAITIQLLDADGNDIASVQSVWIAVFASAAATAFATTGGSTGLAIGSDGALLAVVAKKLFLATCEADGDIDLTWTDTQTESVSVAVILPNGKIVASEAFANAGE